MFAWNAVEGNESDAAAKVEHYSCDKKNGTGQHVSNMKSWTSVKWRQ